MESLASVADTLKSIKETRLSPRRPLAEFFDYQQASKPANFNQAVSRISYNIRHFSGNYGIVVATLTVYTILSNYLLLISVTFVALGLAAINRFVPDAIQVGGYRVTREHLYTSLFVIGISLLWLSSPISTIFGLIGASAVLVLGHASFMESGTESSQVEAV